MKSATLMRRVAGIVIAASLVLCALASEAATVWTGPRITFTKLRGEDATQAEHQDRITPKVWLTRGSSRGLFNIAQESVFTRGSSPADTEWAFGTTANLASLKFSNWLAWHGACPPCAVGKDAVLHLISEDIYLDIKILSWVGASGNVTYERSTPGAAAPPVTSVEYYLPAFDHYFVTADPAEAAIIDANAAATGWMRAGPTYKVNAEPAAGLSPVCRFFSAAFAPKSSHFYTADAVECANVKANSMWQFEGNAFYATLPVAGTCPSGTASLHRLYNDGQGGAPNHRYTTCTSIRDRMVARGWVAEGVTMCVAAPSTDCSTDYSFGYVPGVPTSLVATPGNANITIAFAAPASTGATPITRYTARCEAAGVLRTGANATSPVTVRGVANGVAQTCTVVAANSLGDGPPSAPVVATPAPATNATYNTLAIPPLLLPDRASGIATYDLSLAPSSKQYLAGPPTSTYSYNNSGFWGPTLLMAKGDVVRMQVKNGLPDDTTTHWHGLLLPGAADGGPHSIIAAGSTWLTPPFTVKNNAATYWYHPHRHEMTQKHLTLGAGGFIIVQDPEEAALALPRRYGIDDIPLALTSRRFTTVDGVPNQLQTTGMGYGDHVFTNGTMNAEFTLPRQVVRLRVLNAEIERDYNLGFNDGRTFYVIGNDGGLLSAPAPVTNLIVAPGERYELLVDLTADALGSALDLEAQNGPDSGLAPGFAGFEDESSGAAGSLLNHRTFTLLHIRVGPAGTNPVTAIPARLADNFGLAALTLRNATTTRTIAITGGGDQGPFTFNDLPFDMERIDQSLALNATEAWTVGAGALMSHSFHIHGVQFRMVARNGNASEVQPWEQGWKDTFYLPIGQNATFVGRFADPADAAHPFMYHCHMINHEDEGLMGQFTVQ